MRIVAAVLFFALVAAGLFVVWSDARGPAQPGARAGTNDPSSASTESGPGRDVDAAPTRERIRTVPSPDDPFPAPRTIIRGVLLQGGEPLVHAYVLAGEAMPARTDYEGRFSIDMLQTDRFVEVRGDSVPRGVRIGPIETYGMRVRDVGVLHVPPSVVVVGRVVDEAGNARANVRVYATRDRFVVGVPHDDERADLNTLTRQDGSFRIDGLRAGEVEVRAELPGHHSQRRQVEIRSGVGDVGLVVVTKRPDLTGVVVDAAGRPIAGARVTPGGGSYRLREWESVVTDEAGRFTLVGQGKASAVRVDCEGYAPNQLERVHAQPQPLRVALAEATPLRARVLGLDGADAHFFVDTPEDDYRHTPSWVSRFAWAPQAIAADGTFSIAHLPAGRWVVRVRAPKKGSVAVTPFEIPLDEELVLQLVPDAGVELCVVDDRDRPIAGAEVRRLHVTYSEDAMKAPAALADRWFDVRHCETYTTDEHGCVTVQAPVGEDVGIAVRAPMHVPTAVAFARDAVPEQRMVTLPRAGFVRGHVSSGLGTHSVLASAVVRPVVKGGRGASRLLDAAGVFLAGPLSPGDYTVAVQLADRTHFEDRELPVPDPLPLIHGYEVEGVPVPVTVVAGETVDVQLPWPQVGDVRGRVVAGGRPVAGAIVYCEEVKAEDERGFTFGRERNGLDAYEYAPNCRTDEHGAFHILASTARTIRVRARRETAGAWCAPVEVDVGPTIHVELPDIELPSSAMRGRFDLTAIEPKQRAFVEAQLYPAEKASRDPFFHGDWSTSLSWQSQRQDIGVDGAFAFEGVPPGTWVLRIVVGIDTIVLQRVVQLGEHGVVDFAQLQPPERVQPRLQSGLQEKYGAWLRTLADGVDGGVFVATLGSLRAPDRLPKLPPGRYVLEAFERGPHYAGQLGITGRSTGETATFELHADGTTTPAIVWPDGL